METRSATTTEEIPPEAVGGTDEEVPLRKLTLWSKCSLALLHTFCAFLWFLFRQFRLEKEAGAMFISGMFGFMLFVPPFVCYIATRIADAIWPGVLQTIADLQWVWGPLVMVWFLSTVLIDRAPVDVCGANHRRPRNMINRAAHSFYYWGVFDYFPITCVPWATNATLPLDKQYVFAVHPHGIFCWPLFMFAAKGTPFDDAFPGLCGEKLSGLIASVLFKIPFIRDFFFEWPYVDASRKVANKLLTAGRSVYLIPGGEEESVLTTRGEDVVVLSKRKGFIRLALSHGAAIVPVFGAGNNDTFQTYPAIFGFRRWLQKTFGVALALYHGRFFTPLPFKGPVRVLIGEPIQTPTPRVKGNKPDEALVEEYHRMYIAALKELHKKHVRDRVLRIV